MLLAKTSKYDFLEDFERKFGAFCKRSPLYLSVVVTPSEAIVTSTYGVKTFYFKSNHAEIEIGTIREWLEEYWYPKLCEIVATTALVISSDEIKKSFEKNPNLSPSDVEKAVSQAAAKRIWTITKVNLKRNEMVVVDRLTSFTKVVVLSVPVTIFLRKIIQKEWTPEEGWLKLLSHVSKMREFESRTRSGF
jgi:hypothetical protein